MTTIELTTKEGQKFLCQTYTGWEIHDRGDDPALWVNKEGHTIHATETYEEIKKMMNIFTKLYKFGFLR